MPLWTKVHTICQPLCGVKAFIVPIKNVNISFRRNDPLAIIPNIPLTQFRICQWTLYPLKKSWGDRKITFNGDKKRSRKTWSLGHCLSRWVRKLLDVKIPKATVKVRHILDGGGDCLWQRQFLNPQSTTAQCPKSLRLDLTGIKQYRNDKPNKGDQEARKRRAGKKHNRVKTH